MSYLVKSLKFFCTANLISFQKQYDRILRITVYFLFQIPNFSLFSLGLKLGQSVKDSKLK